MRKTRGEGDWLALARAITGGLNESAQKFDAFKNCVYDPNKSDEANVTHVYKLHDDFVDTDVLVRRLFNKWVTMPHPDPVGVRLVHRQWAVLHTCFRIMIACMSYEYTTYLLASFGNEEQKAIGEDAYGKGVQLYGLLVPPLGRALDSQVDSIDEVMQWTSDVHDSFKPLQDFESQYGDVGAKVRTQMGFKSTW